MTRAKISEYSATAGDNTDVNGTNIAEGCPPSGINDAIREVMAALKRFETGSDGDSVTVGGNLVVSGSTTANTLSTTVLQSDTISEKTSAAGVTVDGVLLKDSGVVTGAGTVSAPVYSTTGDTNTGIFFPAADTIAFAEGGAEAMRIDSSGNVGIGTTSPSARLDVKPTADNFFTGGLRVSRYDNTTQYGAITNDGALQITCVETAVSAPSIRFNTSTDGSTVTERARIDSSGNLLVGTTTANQNGGKINVLFDGNATNGINLKTSYGSTGSYFAVFINSSGTLIGRIEQNGASTVAYTTSSDYRLKENIAPMTGALATVAQLNPVTYNWIADGSTGQGFIAHELQEVVPDCVTGEKDAVETYTDEEGNEQTRPLYQGVDTSFLVATLTAAIQELKAITDTQAQTITALEARIAALEAGNV